MNEAIEKIFGELKARQIHPKGEFDKQGRFYLSDAHLVNVREPSRAWPYSQMCAGRTKKFVRAVADEYNCTNYSELYTAVTGNVDPARVQAYCASCE